MFGTTALVLVATHGIAAGMSALGSERNLFRVMQAVAEAPKVNHRLVEDLTGARLKVAGDNKNPYFNAYEAHGVRLGNVVVNFLEYREPSARGGATAGPILIMRLGAGPCIRREQVSARYAHLTPLFEPGATPSSSRALVAGASSDVYEDFEEEAEFVQREPWGYVAFGFSASPAECLRTAVISFSSPDR